MRAEKKVCFCKELQIQKGIAFQFGLEGSLCFSFQVFEIQVRFEHTCDWLTAFEGSFEVCKRSSQRIVHYLVRETLAKEKFSCKNFCLMKNPDANLCFDLFLASCDQTTWYSK